MSTLHKVRSGEPLRIPAATFNTMIDAARDFQQRRNDVARHTQRLHNPDAGVVLVRNDSGVNVPRFGVLELGGPVFNPSAGSAALAGFQQQIALKGITPTTAAHARFVVTLEPSGPGKFGRAVADGVAIARLEGGAPSGNPSNAGPIPGDVTKLAPGGGSQVLYAEPGSGERWAIVRLSGPRDLFYVRVTQTGGGAGPPSTWTYDVTSPDGQTLGSAMTPQEQRPAGVPVLPGDGPGVGHYGEDGAFELLTAFEAIDLEGFDPAAGTSTDPSARVSFWARIDNDGEGPEYSFTRVTGTDSCGSLGSAQLFQATATFTTANGGTAGGVVWFDTANALDDDPSFAYSAMAALEVTEFLTCTGPKWSLPIDCIAVAQEVRVAVTRSTALGAVVDNTVQLVIGGAPTGANKASPVPWPSAPASATYTWTAGTDSMPSSAALAASGFGVAIKAQAGAASAIPRVHFVQASVTFQMRGTAREVHGRVGIKKDTIVRVFGEPGGSGGEGGCSCWYFVDDSAVSGTPKTDGLQYDHGIPDTAPGWSELDQFRSENSDQEWDRGDQGGGSSMSDPPSLHGAVLTLVTGLGLLSDSESGGFDALRRTLAVRARDITIDADGHVVMYGQEGAYLAPQPVVLFGVVIADETGGSYTVEERFPPAGKTAMTFSVREALRRKLRVGERVMVWASSQSDIFWCVSYPQHFRAQLTGSAGSGGYNFVEKNTFPSLLSPAVTPLTGTATEAHGRAGIPANTEVVIYHNPRTDTYEFIDDSASVGDSMELQVGGAGGGLKVIPAGSGPTPEETTWTRSVDSKGVQVVAWSRVYYDIAPTAPVLYQFRREGRWDSDGHLLFVGPEVRTIVLTASPCGDVT